MNSISKRFIFCVLFFSTVESSIFADIQKTEGSRPRPQFSFTYWYGINSGYGYVLYPSWPTLYWNNAYWNGFSYFSSNYRSFPRKALYAAISYSPEQDVIGGSWQQVSREKATEVANSFCGDETCRPLVWVQGGCAAVVTSKSEERASWGTGINRKSAWLAALHSCRLRNKDGEKPHDCTERGWVCSF
jgi:hypothetical protein